MRGKVSRGSISMSSNRGGGILNGSGGNSHGGGYRGGGNSCDSRGSNMGYGGGCNSGSVMVGHGLGNVVGKSLGFVQGLSVVGSGLNNGFLGKDGLVFNDGVGDMFGGGNSSGNHFGNGSGLVDNSGFGNGVGNSGHL